MKFDTISRGDFLRGAATGAAGIATMSVLGSCASVPKAEVPEGGPSVKDSWRKAPAPITSYSKTVETDVLVVGAGNGGLFAACAAAEKGAKVIVLERNAMVGIGREWIGGIGSRIQKAKGLVPDKHEVIEEVCRYASHRVDQRLIRLWAEQSGPTIDWLESIAKEAGVSMVLETDTGEAMHGVYRTYPIQHNLQNDAGLVKSSEILKKKAVELGVSILFETPLSQLIRETAGSRRVIGAVSATKSGNIRFLAKKGVILATGGYSDNMDMLQEENAVAVKSCSASASSVGSKGDGIKAATWIGAAKDDVPTVMIFDRGGLPVGAPTGNLKTGLFLHMGSQPFLKVNLKGERFCNESVPYDFIVHAASLEKGDSYLMLWDADWKAHTRKFHTIGCSRIQPSPSESKLLLFSEAATEQYHKNVCIPAKVVVEAGTIEELADKLGVPRDTLAGTVKRYNELCAKGADEDFGKESYRMLPLLKPPFRAGHLAGQLLCTLDGLSVNTKLQVLDVEGNPIDGLYAVGNDSGGFFSGNYPEYLVGIACGRTITFGRIAGQTVAGA